MRTHLKLVFGGALLSCALGGLAWLQAQDTPEDVATDTPTPTSDAAAGTTPDDATAGDKWAQIEQTNKDQLKKLEALEKDLNFVRVRVMRARTGAAH